MRDYQIKASKIVLENALNNKYIASVLGSAPSSGKTTISHLILNDYFKKFPSNKALVLTHGQNVLKNQYLNELHTPNVSIEFTYGKIGSQAQVEVGLPQTENTNKYDLIIIDEAHAFYGQKMVNEIIKKSEAKHLILMTGSVTEFNAHNQGLIYKVPTYKKYAIHYISADELEKEGVFSPIMLDAKKVTGDVTFQYQNIINHLIGRNRNVDKQMISVKTIKEAKELSIHIAKTMKVFLSTSENDSNNGQIQEFKDFKGNCALIVVYKGILGFNDPNITCLIDLKASNDLDNSYQFFARGLRKHPQGIDKTYIRASLKDYNKSVTFLHKLVSLMDGKIYRTYNGKNL